MPVDQESVIGSDAPRRGREQWARVSQRDTMGDVRIKHTGLRALHERGGRVTAFHGLGAPAAANPVRLEGATRPGNMSVPGYYLHPRKGARRGHGAFGSRVTGAWCSDSRERRP